MYVHLGDLGGLENVGHLLKGVQNRRTVTTYHLYRCVKN